MLKPCGQTSLVLTFELSFTIFNVLYVCKNVCKLNLFKFSERLILIWITFMSL